MSRSMAQTRVTSGTRTLQHALHWRGAAVHRRPPVRCRSTASIAIPHLSFDGHSLDAFPAVKPLPAPPKVAHIGSVLSYLAQLAMTERQLTWRLGLALACMIISKGAGACGVLLRALPHSVGRAHALSCAPTPGTPGLMGPLFLKKAVDSLGGAAAAAAADPVTAAIKAVVCFGMCGVLQHLAKVGPPQRTAPLAGRGAHG